MANKHPQNQNEKPQTQTGAGYQAGNSHVGNSDRVSDQSGASKSKSAGNQQRNNQPASKKGKSS